MKQSTIKPLFLIAAAYDGALGLVFLFAGCALFNLAGVTPPNHMGYVQFPAALLVVFALMFLAVARNPTENRDLIPYGALFKLCYAGVVFFYWITSAIPGMWKLFAVIDLIFAILFAVAYFHLKKADAGESQPE